jgi:hypothetical protein
VLEVAPEVGVQLLEAFIHFLSVLRVVRPVELDVQSLEIQSEVPVLADHVEFRVQIEQSSLGGKEQAVALLEIPVGHLVVEVLALLQLDRAIAQVPPPGTGVLQELPQPRLGLEPSVHHLQLELSPVGCWQDRARFPPAGG